jgi:AbrB family looped-hinge helix DNA binding protein
MQTTIDSAGRIVVPKPLRDELGLVGGERLEIRAHDGTLEVDVIPVPMHLVERGGVPSAIPSEPLPALTAHQVREILERVRR